MMAFFSEPYLREVFPFDSANGRIVVTILLTLAPLIYAWIRVRPLDNSEPKPLFGMDAPKLALVTVGFALGAVVFVLIGSAFIQDSFDRDCNCNWILEGERYQTMSVLAEYAPTSWLMPLFFLPFGVGCAMLSVHVLKRAMSVSENRSGIRSVAVWWWFFITMNVAFWSVWEIILSHGFGRGPDNMADAPRFLLNETHHIFGSYFYFFSGCFCALFGWLAMIPEARDRKRLNLPNMPTRLRAHALSAFLCVFQGIHYLVIYESPQWYRFLVGGDNSWWVGPSVLGVNETFLILTQIFWGVLIFMYLKQEIPETMLWKPSVTEKKI